MISQFFLLNVEHIYITSVSGYCIFFIFKTCQTVVCTSMINQFHDFFEQELLEVSDVTAPRGLASPDSISTMTPTSSTGSNAEAGSDNSAAEMSRLYEAINAQKDVIMKCLESDTCDISGLNEQLGILQTMQQK